MNFAVKWRQMYLFPIIHDETERYLQSSEDRNIT